MIEVSNNAGDWYKRTFKEMDSYGWHRDEDLDSWRFARPLAPEELKPLAWDWLEIIEDCAEKSSGKESEYDKYLIDAL